MKRGDVEALDRDDIDLWATAEAFGNVNEFDDWIGRAFTAVEDGRPIGVSGFSLDESGVGTGWLIGSRQLRAKPMFLHRTMRRVIARLRADPKVARIEIVVRADCAPAVRWAERLGFRATEGGAPFVRYGMEACHG